MCFFQVKPHLNSGKTPLHVVGTALNIAALTLKKLLSYHDQGEGEVENHSTKVKVRRLRLEAQLLTISGADPGFFLGESAPLRNDVTDQ